MKIVVLDGATLHGGDNPWDPVAALGELTVHDGTPPGQIVERCAGATVVVTNKVPLSGQTLAALPELRLIAVTATGYNIVDVAAAAERGVLVANVPEYGTASVAQFTFALLLELCHHVGHHAAAVGEGRWGEVGNFCFWDTPLVELAGLTMGVVGFGRIGRTVGRIARAMGMTVIAADPFGADAPDWAGFRWATVEELFADADVVSLHCPQTADNTGMVNAELLARMKPSAFLVNTARGGLVVEADLAEALAAGRPAGAAVDVAATEPIDPDSPLLAAPNCLVTPHIAWASLAARRRLMSATAENIAAFQAGKPVNIVNA